MLKRTDYLVIMLLASNAMITTALGVHVSGFALPAAVVFCLVVGNAAIAAILAVLPALGIRVPATDTHPVASE